MTEFLKFQYPRLPVADPAVHARITRSKTAWASTRANIAEAVRRGIPVHAAIVDGIDPAQDARAAEAVLRALGVTSIRIRPVQRAGRAAGRGRENDPAELCGHCGAGRAAVLPDGQLTPCVIGRWMDTGNVKTTPLREILTGRAWRDALAQVPRTGDPDPCPPNCPPSQDGGDCPPATQPACPPSFCPPDLGGTLGVPARVTVRQAG